MNMPMADGGTFAGIAPDHPAAHPAEAPTTALLFALNGLAYAALSADVFLSASWRPVRKALTP